MGFAVLALMTACGQTLTTETIYRDIPVTVTVPTEIRRCAESPPVPDQESRMAGINTYIIDLHEAHADCYRNLRTFNGIIRNFEMEIDSRATEAANAAGPR